MGAALEKFLEETVRPGEQSSDYLMIMNGPEDGRTCALTKSLTVIGRLGSNDVALTLDPTISRVHAQVTREQGVYYIEDLNSTLGTEVDGKKLSAKKEMRDGTMILVGETFLCFRLASLEKP
ncbi:MAG: FHA domain-containing protein [Blastocatellia bacterium]|nr:FHA domain-containing protein [Blastocatellia bacterium]